MKHNTHYFRIGLFVVVGAALFVGALFALGLRSEFGRPDLFETRVPGDVDNLSAGALVKLRGVTIGKVTFVGFAGSEYPGYNEQSVLIHFAVPRNSVWSAETNNIQALLDAEAARGLRARVEAQGFLGANILALDYVDPKLYPVEPLPWTPKHYYIPSAPNQITRVLASLEKSLQKVDEIDLNALLERARRLIDDADQVALKARGLIDHADQVAVNVNQIDFHRLGTNATDLVAELRETNRRLQTAINGADLPEIGRETVAMENKLSSAATELRRFLAGVDTGDLNGSLANIRSATDELIALLHTLEQRPSAVLFSRPPPPVSQFEKPPKQ